METPKTTREAFEELIKTKKASELGQHKKEFYNARNYFKQGKISIERMEMFLEKFGYRVVTEKTWTKD